MVKLGLFQISQIFKGPLACMHAVACAFLHAQGDAYAKPTSMNRQAAN